MMNQASTFHIVTVGWDRVLVESLWKSIAMKGEARFSHILHPSCIRGEFPNLPPESGMYFFRDHLRHRMPDPDIQFLASLEQEDVPTIHNMILGDRIVSKLSYSDALSYATFLGQRLFSLFRQLKPSVVIGGFDAIHSGLALAVAKRMNIPWYALHFSVIPSGLTCFCDRMSPAARVRIRRSMSPSNLRSFAENSLSDFEKKSIQAPAYIAPKPLSLIEHVAKLPRRASSLAHKIRRSRDREFLQFTEMRAGHSVLAALSHFHRIALARKAPSKVVALEVPPEGPYVLFGLHFQPESSIDVWAPYFSNQMWVIELLARSIPPAHKLLVKIHKSDAANYTVAQLERMRSFPGVELIRPFADTRRFIERADLIIAIQGTIGLEAALLGKPVIMLGDSPVAVFPSASRIGEIVELPGLIRKKLGESPPGRDQIIEAYAEYLAPFIPASHNDWTKVDVEEIGGYVKLFDALREHVNARPTLTFCKTRDTSFHA